MSLLQGKHSRWLQVEVAWLLAFICAGTETHMHTMVKHGAAEAVVKCISSTISEVCVYTAHSEGCCHPGRGVHAGSVQAFSGPGSARMKFSCGDSLISAHFILSKTCFHMQQDRSVDEPAALLIPLLRCLGNMGSSKSAAHSLLSSHSTLAVSCCAESENVALQREALWVMARLNELSKG